MGKLTSEEIAECFKRSVAEAKQLAGFRAVPNGKAE